MRIDSIVFNDMKTPTQNIAKIIAIKHKYQDVSCVCSCNRRGKCRSVDFCGIAMESDDVQRMLCDPHFVLTKGPCYSGGLLCFRIIDIKVGTRRGTI